MTLEVQKLQSMIRGALDQVNDELIQANVNDSVWTKKIKESLVRLGNNQKLKLKCYASGVKGEGVSSGEWLYDLCWIRFEDNQIASIELIMESEWIRSFKEVRDDFQKLVQARATLRLMIWQAKSSNDMEKHRDVLVRQIQAFRASQQDDSYLFSCWVADDQKFAHYAYPPVENAD